jgi:hypothetical protein
MPRQLREMFAFICCFCQPASPLKLWDDHKVDFILDYKRQEPDNIVVNRALHYINAVLIQHGLSCAAFGLPTLSGEVHEE